MEEHLGNSMLAVTNEGLAIEIKNLSLQISDLKLQLSSTSSTFVSRDIYELKMKQIELRILELEDSLRKASSSKWVQNTLSAILGAVLAILISFFLTHLGS